MPTNLNILTNDGNATFGTGIVSINGSSYYYEASTGNSNATVHDIPNEVGAPRKQVIIQGKKTGTITLQFETTSSYIPSQGDKWIVPVGLGASGSAFTASITSVSTPRSNSSHWTMECGWTELLN